jgi:hypothetical protein
LKVPKSAYSLLLPTNLTGYLNDSIGVRAISVVQRYQSVATVRFHVV